MHRKPNENDRQRGNAQKLPSGKWSLRYYDAAGKRQRGGTFPTKSAALNHFRDVIRPQLNGEPVADAGATFDDLCERFLTHYALGAAPSTVRCITAWLVRPRAEFGETALPDFERADLGAFIDALPTPYLRYSLARGLRQVCKFGVKRGLLARNPADKLEGYGMPKRVGGPRVFSPVEIDTLAEELPGHWGAAIVFASETGLRPAEFLRAERGDVDRASHTLYVRGTKTTGSRREVPLTDRALAAIDSVPPRLDTRLLFPGRRGGPVSPHNFRNRYFAPAVESGGIETPARPYDLRSTFASNALAARVTTFELARIMGTSEAIIQEHYGTLVQGAGDDIRRRLNARPTTDAEEAAEA